MPSAITFNEIKNYLTIHADHKEFDLATVSTIIVDEEPVQKVTYWQKTFCGKFMPVLASYSDEK